VKWDAGARTLTIRGSLCRAVAPIMTPASRWVWLLALTIGRANPNWLRLLIQNDSSRAGRTAPHLRGRSGSDDTIEITDEIDLHGAGRPVAVIASRTALRIYVASSNSFQAANLLPVRRLEGCWPRCAKGTGLRNIRGAFPVKRLSHCWSAWHPGDHLSADGFTRLGPVFRDCDPLWLV